MSDARDIQHGLNDPVSGVDVKRKFQDNKTPHECAHRAPTSAPTLRPRRTKNVDRFQHGTCAF